MSRSSGSTRRGAWGNMKQSQVRSMSGEEGGPFHTPLRKPVAPPTCIMPTVETKPLEYPKMKRAPRVTQLLVCSGMPSL
eukprot:4118055-Ditylum_brightwellii.AAC.1